MVAAVILGLLLAGCNRTFYRVQADEEAQFLVAEKSCDPRWAADGFTIEMDPRSRYYDPYDRDFPPMPHDDPAAHQFMHCVDGKRGWPHWHNSGQVDDLTNPGWHQFLPDYVDLNERGEILLNLESAVGLALVNSPDFQQQLETVYLSALDVSTERFRFDVQFFGGEAVNFRHKGSLVNPVGEADFLTSSIVGPNGGGTPYRMERRFATAGQLLVGFANSFVWQFAGPDTYTTSSLLNFSLVQPLLRSGGRAVGLEQLTLAERTLLANLRALEQYRQGFYTEIAVGNRGVRGPQRRGGFFGGTGLTGFTGQGAGGFGGVGQATGFGGGLGGAGAAAGGTGATTGFAGGFAGSVGGYLGLLQQLQQIINTQNALNAELHTLALLEAHQAAGLIDIVQVDQLRQTIETERANLLLANNNLANSLENYKIQTLGLPPDLPMALDDTLIKPFQFVDPATTAMQNRITDFIARFGELPRQPEVESIERAIAEALSLERGVRAAFLAMHDDLKNLEATTPARLEQMTDDEQAEFQSTIEELRRSLGGFQARLDATARRLDELKQGLSPETREQTADAVVTVMVELMNVVGEASLVQARARLESIVLERFDLNSQDALTIARNNRLDWMNNRAALVDTWRLIAFNANALQSNLSITLSGDVGTNGDNPLAFTSRKGNLQAGLQIDPPLTRRIERNSLRQQLIQYQQSRRQLIQFRDGVYFNLRQLLRQLQQLQVNLEIQRRAVAIAVRRVDQTREALNKPIPPAIPGQPPVQFGPKSALNLLTALSDLRSSQNNFISVWLNFRATKMQLFRELGIMEIDGNGLWVERPLLDVRPVPEEECELPPEVPMVWFDHLDRIDALDESFEVPPAPDGTMLPHAEPTGHALLGDTLPAESTGLPPTRTPMIPADANVNVRGPWFWLNVYDGLNALFDSVELGAQRLWERPFGAPQLGPIQQPGE